MEELEEPSQLRFHYIEKRKEMGLGIDSIIRFPYRWKYRINQSIPTDEYIYRVNDAVSAIFFYQRESPYNKSLVIPSI